MKNTILFLSLLLLIGYQSLAQEKKLQASLYYVNFYSPSDGPYVETYLSVIGNSAVFIKNDNGKLQASIEVTMMFRKDNKVMQFRKLNLLSPEVEMSSLKRPNFIDVQRVLLDSGEYVLELIIRDMNSDNEPFTSNVELNVEYNDNELSISGCQFVESYTKAKEQNILTKGGYDLVPYVSNFFPDNIDDFIFNVEIYNSDKRFGEEASYLIRYYIESYDTQKSLSSFEGFSREKSQEVSMLFRKIDISKLPSGNYYLVVEVRNKTNELIKQRKFFFQRSNPNYGYSLSDIAAVDTKTTFVNQYNDIAILKDFIKSLIPIADASEARFIDNLLNQDDSELMKQFLYNFWLNRNGSDPASEWKQYMEKVSSVNKSYGSQIKEGYETDRGVVYLKYGLPNIIRKSEHEPNIYPFEIWQYYELNGKQNRKFLFYNPEIAGNDYKLLHSNVQGEPYSKNWIDVLTQRSNLPGHISGSKSNDNSIRTDNNYGSHILEIWNNP